MIGIVSDVSVAWLSEHVTATLTLNPAASTDAVTARNDLHRQMRGQQEQSKSGQKRRIVSL
ncbi:hypothetical protein N9P48_00845 [bacterium]|nr:hypothetical protein [bacterium]